MIKFEARFIDRESEEYRGRIDAEIKGLDESGIDTPTVKMTVTDKDGKIKVLFDRPMIEGKESGEVSTMVQVFQGTISSFSQLCDKEHGGDTRIEIMEINGSAITKNGVLHVPPHKITKDGVEIEGKKFDSLDEANAYVQSKKENSDADESHVVAMYAPMNGTKQHAESSPQGMSERASDRLQKSADLMKQAVNFGSQIGEAVEKYGKEKAEILAKAIIERESDTRVREILKTTLAITLKYPGFNQELKKAKKKIKERSIGFTAPESKSKAKKKSNAK